jgi:hypothetical protein
MVDMTLSLSENTINYQFQQLCQRRIIQKTWKILVRQTNDSTGKPTYVVKTQEDSDFDAALMAWRSAQKEIADLFAAKKYTEFGIKLGQAEAAGVLYTYGWSAEIKPPTIQILKGATSTLMFKLLFASGTLYSSTDTTRQLAVYDLSDCLYAFNVPVGRIEINDKQKILTPQAQEQATIVIREAGLTDADFTIESLFLDFERANVSNFDQTLSSFPENMTSDLQTTIQNYFNLVVAKQDNPYILGYAMQVREVKTQKALFQPTSVRYSTSYSDNRRFNAFNFLMMGGGREFLSGQNVGVLPQSLLEKGADDPSLDGVFAIDYGIFQNNLIEPFVNGIQKVITNGFSGNAYTRDGQRWSLIDSASSSDTISMPPSDVGKDTKLLSNSKVTSSIHLSNTSTGSLQLRCIINYEIRLRVEVYTVFGFRYVTRYEAYLSTGGQHHVGPTGKMGIPGSVTLTIQPGCEGKVNFNTSEIQSPALGYDKEPKTQDTSGPWGIITSLNNEAARQVLSRGALDAANDMRDVIEDVKKSIQATINSLTNGKVILPLGQIYTFNQIQLYDVINTDNDAVLLNVAYARVSN